VNNTYFKHILQTSLGENHHLEVYKTRDTVTIRKLGFDFDFRRRTDHGGFSLCFGLLGKALIIEVYDTRHWDDEKKEYKAK
jgi:hypothetical protein